MIDPQDKFEIVAREKRESFFREYAQFLRREKTYWLVLLVLLLVILAVIIISRGPAAPFIYSLF